MGAFCFARAVPSTALHCTVTALLGAHHPLTILLACIALQPAVTGSGGGGCSAACGVSEGCASTWDCRTRTCGTSGQCQQLSSCTNGLFDTASEGAQDCGDSCDRKCGVASTCRINGDCISGVCTTGRCTDAPTCRNSIRDGRETDVDW